MPESPSPSSQRSPAATGSACPGARSVPLEHHSAAPRYRGRVATPAPAGRLRAVGRHHQPAVRDAQRAHLRCLLAGRRDDPLRCGGGGPGRVGQQQPGKRPVVRHTSVPSTAITGGPGGKPCSVLQAGHEQRPEGGQHGQRIAGQAEHQRAAAGQARPQHRLARTQRSPRGTGTRRPAHSSAAGTKSAAPRETPPIVRMRSGGGSDPPAAIRNAPATRLRPVRDGSLRTSPRTPQPPARSAGSARWNCGPGPDSAATRGPRPPRCRWPATTTRGRRTTSTTAHPRLASSSTWDGPMRRPASSTTSPGR